MTEETEIRVLLDRTGRAMPTRPAPSVAEVRRLVIRRRRTRVATLAVGPTVCITAAAVAAMTLGVGGSNTGRTPSTLAGSAPGCLRAGAPSVSSFVTANGAVTAPSFVSQGNNAVGPLTFSHMPFGATETTGCAQVYVNPSSKTKSYSRFFQAVTAESSVLVRIDVAPDSGTLSTVPLDGSLLENVSTKNNELRITDLHDAPVGEGDSIEGSFVQSGYLVSATVKGGSSLASTVPDELVAFADGTKLSS